MGRLSPPRTACVQSLQDFSGIQPARAVLGRPPLEGACASAPSVKHMDHFSDKVSVNSFRNCVCYDFFTGASWIPVKKQLQTQIRDQCWSVKLELSASQRDEEKSQLTMMSVTFTLNLKLSPNFSSQPHASFPPSGDPSLAQRKTFPSAPTPTSLGQARARRRQQVKSLLRILTVCPSAAFCFNLSRLGSGTPPASDSRRCGGALPLAVQRPLCHAVHSRTCAPELRGPSATEHPCIEAVLVWTVGFRSFCQT